MESSVSTNYHGGNLQGNCAALNKADKESGFQLKLRCLVCDDTEKA